MDQLTLVIWWAVSLSRLDTTAEVRKRSLQGMWLLVISLAILFLASMLLSVAYIAYRLGRSPEPDELFIVPRSLWLSTGLLLVVSAGLHFAIYAAKRSRFIPVMVRTTIALGAALVFLLVQSDAMSYLVLQTRSFDKSAFSPYPYTVVLAFLHALHVLAGLVGLLIVTTKAYLRLYDHEKHLGLEVCAIYWHFLDIVWVVMLASFYVASYVFNSA